MTVQLKNCRQGLTPWREQLSDNDNQGGGEMGELKSNITKLAIEEGKTKLEIITALQGIAASTNNSELLENLCELKAEILGI